MGKVLKPGHSFPFVKEVHIHEGKEGGLDKSSSVVQEGKELTLHNLAKSVAHVTLDPRVVSSSSPLGLELTLKNK